MSFSPLSDGTSVYYSNDKEIQWALEHHYKFGVMFRLAEETEEQSASVRKSSKSSGKKPFGKGGKKSNSSSAGASDMQPRAEEETAESSPIEEYDGEKDQEEETKLREVSVSDLDAAKDYLAENFDVVRTKLKSEDIINATALSYGILFKYL